MAVWNYADMWEMVAAAQPERPALAQGDRVIAWGELDARADALAAHLLAAGLQQGATVAAYLYNAPEYMETYYAAFKAGLAPINTNYRYGAEELFYLFDNADSEAVVFHAGFADRVEAIRHRLPAVKAWIAVADPGHDVPAWADDYDAIVAAPPASRPVRAPWGRSNDDLLILYTGGTTGMPKGVMWRQEDLFHVLGGGGTALLGIPPFATPEEVVPRLAATPLRPVALIACPLMHGTGLMGALSTMIAGGLSVFLPSRKFDARELWDEVERHRATRVSIVGLAFCAPMLDALEGEPGRWDLSSVALIASSGAMWSYENKQGLLRHLPQALLADAFSSSEAIGMGTSVSTAGGEMPTAKFAVGPNCAVFAEDGRRVAPGSGERGLVGVGGHIPLGYFKDDDKTARTFPTYEGRRWSVPGDWAEVEADGTLKLLGRGSQCINTGGEKVFPEEVEEALKRHPSVRDAAVVGLPDARFGERIFAIVELERGAPEPSLTDLSAHVRTQLADYKAPRGLLIVTSVGRAPNGKLDYKALKATASERAA